MLRGVIVATLLVLGLTAGAAEAAPCPKGKLAWTVEGRRQCVTTAAVSGTPRPTSADAAERVLLAASRSAPVGRRNALPAAARRRLAKGARGIGRRIGVLEQRALAARPTLRGGALRARLVQAQTITSPTFTEGGITARASATITAAGAVTIGLEASVKVGDDTVALDLDVTPGFDPPTDRCPDAAGRVRSKDTSGGRLTTKTLRGRKVLSTQTVKTSTTTETVGQVGDDGFLQGSTSTVTTTTGSFSSGLGVESRSTITVTGGNDGRYTATGAPKVDATVRSATAGAAVERAAEKLIAERLATSGEAAKSAGSDAGRGRARVQEQQAGWTSLEKNPCIDVAWDPATPGAVEPGQTVAVTGRVIRKDGAAAAPATAWSVVYIGEGSFSGTGPSFTATGGEPGGTGQTVLAAVVVASRSGRVQAPWFAKGSGLPAVFTATMSQHEDMQASFGVVLDFDLTATWTRTSVSVNPDGSRTAFYGISAATNPRWVYDQSTGGCVYHGEGAGGTPVSGDVELRVAPDGAVSYGFVADVDLGRPTIPKSGGPEGCPGSISPNLKAIVQARRKPDSALYPAPPGSRNGTSFDVTVKDLTDSIGDSDGVRDLVTSWTLTGR